MSLPKRILIVEDDRVLRRACEAGLRKRGYEVVTADNGVDGLELAVAQKFDIVLLDMLMPRMSGLDMLRELRRRAPGQLAPVLVLSNSSRTGDRQEVAALGVAGYMVKACLSLESLAMKVAELTSGGPS
jgi:two-component system, chemotaxis family, chemotaxis protein CheY